ncbi:PASTA domain-containing protein [Streptomyces sp. HSW2009]|uniref:PASTA domain-containing protein n=1 Tax=Streptomyces sp. HSW2009 TaxID=3142890 RepID=UPI0032EADEA4
MIVAFVLLWVLPPWKWGAKLGATVGTFVLLVIAGGVSGQLDEEKKDEAKPVASKSGAPAGEPSASPSGTRAPVKAEASRPAVPDYVGKPLDQAEKSARAAGFSVGAHDASEQRRSIVLRSGWLVCFQHARVDDGRGAVDFGAVKDGEPCPKREGEPLPWPTMPELTGKTWKAASTTLTGLGVAEDRIEAEAAYTNDPLPAEGSYDDWEVCASEPDAGDDIQTTRTPAVTLRLTDPGQPCPGGGSTELPDEDDDGTPDYRDRHDDREMDPGTDQGTDEPGDDLTSGSGGSSYGGSSGGSSSGGSSSGGSSLGSSSWGGSHGGWW